jgi:hypothetical protein
MDSRHAHQVAANRGDDPVPGRGQPGAMQPNRRVRKPDASAPRATPRSRTTLFHYPIMHADREEAGAEELANALRAAKDIDGWIEGGEEYASFRASFADEVAVQFLAESGDAAIELMDKLTDDVFDLVRFAEVVLFELLKRVPAGRTTVWKRGHPKPALPG